MYLWTVTGQNSWHSFDKLLHIEFTLSFSSIQDHCPPFSEDKWAAYIFTCLGTDAKSPHLLADDVSPFELTKELHTSEFKVARFRLPGIWKPDFKRSLVQAVPDLSAPWYRCDP